MYRGACVTFGHQNAPSEAKRLTSLIYSSVRLARAYQCTKRTYDGAERSNTTPRELVRSSAPISTARAEISRLSMRSGEVKNRQKQRIARLAHGGEGTRS